MPDKHTYKSAGVDIDAGNKFVKSIDELVSRTHRSEVLTSIGGFGGLFEPDFSKCKQPVLVSSIDGVGTKLIIAFKTGVYNTVGQCLVNHCVNDIAVCGAEPLFFLDYFSTGTLKQEIAYEVLKGFSMACEQNGCTLIGGETAEMPDIYAEDEFDLAGTVVGVVDKQAIINGSGTREGDVILGVTGNGLHTNGYSLARKVLFSRYKTDDFIAELGMTIGESLLQIHPSYLQVIRQLRSEVGIRGFGHVTGGGIIGNTKRIVPEGLYPVVDWNSWEWPAIFTMISNEGNVPVEDMRQTFNLGIGLTVVVSPASAEKILKISLPDGFRIHRIGEIRTSR